MSQAGRGHLRQDLGKGRQSVPLPCEEQSEYIGKVPFRALFCLTQSCIAEVEMEDVELTISIAGRQIVDAKVAQTSHEWTQSLPALPCSRLIGFALMTSTIGMVLVRH